MLALLAVWFLGWAVLADPRQPHRTCGFKLWTSDDVFRVVGQRSGGQVQGGSVDLPSARFHLRNGSLYDSLDRGCWWVEPTTVLVCDILDDNWHPAPFFKILTSPGRGVPSLVYKNRIALFWQCPAAERGRFFLYLRRPQGIDGCRAVALQVDRDELGEPECG